MRDRYTGEMHAIPSGPKSYVELPRAGGVAYAAQESWIQNETIKVSDASFGRGMWRELMGWTRVQENILFGSEFDETRYNKGMSLAVLKRVYSHAPPNSVIKQCALERDLSLFAAGDNTEVGEKGVTLR